MNPAKVVAFFEAAIAVGCMMIGYHVGKMKADQWYSKRCVHEWIIGLDAETTPFLQWPNGSCLAAVGSDKIPGKVHMILIHCEDIPK